jgi:hypothetical protein
MVRPLLRRADTGTGGSEGSRSPPRRTRRELEDVQAIAIIVFALLAVVVVFVYVLASGSLRFFDPDRGKAVSAASAPPAPGIETSQPTLPGSIGGSSASLPSPTPVAPPVASPDSTSSPTVLGESEGTVVETFQLTPMGVFRDRAWRVSPSTGALTIVAVPTSVDRSLRVGPTPDGEPVVACRDLQVEDRRLTVEATLRLDDEVAGGPLLSIGTGQSAVLLGRDARGRLIHTDGPNMATAGLAIRPGDWYRLVVEVDPTGETYGFDAQAVDGGASPVRQAGLAVGRPSEEMDGLCFTAAGAAGASITVDEIRITTR